MSGPLMPRQMVIRVSDDLYEALQRDADDNERTLAQTVRFYLRKALAHSAEHRGGS